MTGSNLQSTLDRLDELKRRYEALSALGDKIEELKEEINKCQPYLTDKAKVNLRNMAGKAETKLKDLTWSAVGTGPGLRVGTLGNRVVSVESVDASSDGGDKMKPQATHACRAYEILREIFHQNVGYAGLDENNEMVFHSKPDRRLVPEGTLRRMLLLLLVWGLDTSDFKRDDDAKVAEHKEAKGEKPDHV